MTFARQFRDMMNAPEILVVPSAYDALSAKVIELKFVSVA